MCANSQAMLPLNLGRGDPFAGGAAKLDRAVA
jgi:hypothetical protein